MELGVATSQLAHASNPGTIPLVIESYAEHCEENFNGDKLNTAVK